MEAKVLVHTSSRLKVKLAVTNTGVDYSYLTTKLSPEYGFGGSTVFQVRLTTVYICTELRLTWKDSVFIRFVKCHQDDNLTYTIKFTSSKLGISNKSFTSDDGTWHLVNENEFQKQYKIDVAVQVDMVPSASSFAPLHEDIKLLDFELRGEDGSVRFHKAVLAASSPVLRRMLGGRWRCTTVGDVDVPGTSKRTLENLKNYIYLHTLPDDDLEQLLLLSSCYMMPELEQSCVDKIISNLTEKNACDLLEFAGLNKLTRLQLAILESVENRAVDINKMRDHLLGTERAKLVQYSSEQDDDDNCEGQEDDEIEMV